ncbi:hypothetical protein ACFVFI_34835 [Streptomyces sp. NPDC057705]|uniref:hypothetical protein n=1 Tax=Streptomyces sp. NPDC057705 TaxID=3346222 RepID=UPI0036BED09D
MMPLVAAEGADAEQRPRSRIRNTRRLLTTAALIMSTLVLCGAAMVAAGAVSEWRWLLGIGVWALIVASWRR